MSESPFFKKIMCGMLCCALSAAMVPATALAQMSEEARPASEEALVAQGSNAAEGSKEPSAQTPDIVEQQEAMLEDAENTSNNGETADKTADKMLQPQSDEMAITTQDDDAPASNKNYPTDIFNVFQDDPWPEGTTFDKGSSSLSAEAAKSKYAYWSTGSYGFFEWIASQYANDSSKAWMVQDAQDAMRVLKGSTYKSYTKLGAAGDATSLANVSLALNMHLVLNKVRKQDNNFKNLKDAYVNSTMLAVAQIHANASSKTYNHMMNDNVEVDLARGSECLAWGYGTTGYGPFAGWYFTEKQNYDARRAYFIKNYNVDIADPSQTSKYFSLPDSVRTEKSFGEMGHYGITTMHTFIVAGYSPNGDTSNYYRELYEIILGGLAYNNSGSTWSLRMNGIDLRSGETYQNKYTIAEYTKLFNQYLSWVRTDVSKSSVKAIPAQARTGKAIKPALTVSQDGRTLKAGTDYSISYQNNVNVGTATAVISGKGAYKGTKKVTFKIYQPLEVTYRTHVQRVGWQGWKKNGVMSGTSGKAFRLEGIKVYLAGKPYSGGIQYRTHVQRIGWQGWRKDGVMSGTEGQAKRLEAIQIQLYGEMAKHYDVYYRVHCQRLGWMGWAKNGARAGTAGFAYRLEGIQILLVKKGGAAPPTTYRGLKQNYARAFRQR